MNGSSDPQGRDRTLLGLPLVQWLSMAINAAVLAYVCALSPWAPPSARTHILLWTLLLTPAAFVGLGAAALGGHWIILFMLRSRKPQPQREER